MFGSQEMIERATVLLSGRVIEATHLTNARTNDAFWAVRIDTWPGPTDVVMDDDVMSGEPGAGRLAIVRGWVVGRPVEPPPPGPKSFWSRFRR